jgi:hypothetical protein
VTYYLLSNLGGWHIHGEILEYDPKTSTMKLRVCSGDVYERAFLPKAKYNQSDYRVVVFDEDEPDAKLAKLQAQFEAGIQDRQETRRLAEDRRKDARP